MGVKPSESLLRFAVDSGNLRLVNRVLRYGSELTEELAIELALLAAEKGYSEIATKFMVKLRRWCKDDNSLFG